MPCFVGLVTFPAQQNLRAEADYLCMDDLASAIASRLKSLDQQQQVAQQQAAARAASDRKRRREEMEQVVGRAVAAAAKGPALEVSDVVVVRVSMCVC